MPRATVLDYLGSFPGTDILRTSGADFFYYDPQRDVPHDKRQPFATVITADDYDHASNLAQRGAYRVNMGVSRETYRSLFGSEPAWGKDGGPVATGHDFTRLDTFLPHPIYAPMGWICIVCPSESRWPTVQDHLREAHALAARQYARRRPSPS